VTSHRITRRWTRLALAAAGLAGLAIVWIADRDDPPSEAELRRAELADAAWTLAPHEGIGAWIDVYDWTEELSGGDPQVGLSDIDRMAELGVETLYVQSAHDRSVADGIIERERLEAIVARARDRGLHVVAWYLPTLVDPEADLRRLVASAELPVDGLGVDIESLDVADVSERNRRLLELTRRLRAEVGDDRVIAAITPSPIHLQVVNPGFWPAFPWPELAAAYDAILPMSYWSIRDAALRDGERYVADDIDRVRASTGDPDIPIHVIGGIADALPVAQVEGMVRAVVGRDVLGGSLYDWATSSEDHWGAMGPLGTRD